MGGQAAEWLAYAEADLTAATELIDTIEPIAAYHAHQAAENGVNALQIHREGDHDRTHDLVRLYHGLDVPEEYRGLLEHLNPADTAARYPDADPVRFDNPHETIHQVEDLLEWIRTRLSE